MEKINIKPLSVNNAWMGRRFRTQEYKNYEIELSLFLPKIKIPKCGKLKVFYRFGLSSKKADGDNCIKQFQDVICKKYGFDDKRIYVWNVEKVDVKKGEEFVEFKIEKI